MLIVFRRLSIVLMMLALTGCKEVLYSDLDQVQANDMVAILEASGITTTRAVTKDGLYSLKVSKEDIAKAVVTLRERGLPKERFAGLGDIFQAEGIMGTPFEQHVRFIHAMNEELSQAITSISGVRQAKVLITLPLPKRYDRNPVRASASVTVHTQPGFDVGGNMSKLKRLVSSAVPDLAYEDVTISSFSASAAVITNHRDVTTWPTETLNVDGESFVAPAPDPITRNGWAPKVVTPASLGMEIFDDLDMAKVFWRLGLFALGFAALCLVLRLTRKARF